jgi:hypothetical protein
MLRRHKRFNNETLDVQERNNTANEREPSAKNAFK